MVYLPRVLQLVKCLVLGFLEVVHSAGRIQEHFMYRHFWSNVAVVQYGPLPRCELCGIQMPAGWLIKHCQTAICEKKTQMQWRGRDVVIANKFPEATFSFTGEDGSESVEVVEVF